MKTSSKIAASLLTLGAVLATVPAAQAIGQGCAPVCATSSCYFNPNKKFGIAGVKLGMKKVEAEKGLLTFFNIPYSYLVGIQGSPVVKPLKEIEAEAENPLFVSLMKKLENERGLANIEKWDFSFVYMDPTQMIGITVKAEKPSEAAGYVVDTITMAPLVRKDLEAFLKIKQKLAEDNHTEESQIRELEKAITKLKHQDRKERRADFEKEILQKFGCPTISTINTWQWCRKLNKGGTACAPGGQPMFVYREVLGYLKLTLTRK